MKDLQLLANQKPNQDNLKTTVIKMDANNISITIIETKIDRQIKSIYI